MEENRFIRAYKEFKCEQQRNKTVNPNNRFACLLEEKSIIKTKNRRFDCLINNEYNDLKIEYTTATTYLPRISPPKVPEPIKPNELKETNSKILNIVKEKPPDFSFDSSYHFPNLFGESNIVKKTEIQMIEAKNIKEMIVNSIKVPVKKPIFTSLKWNNGKIIKKDIYDDGVEIEENKPRIIIQKPIYSSWASVVKPKEYIYTEKENFEVSDNLFDDY